jgi:hypothetical protein
MLPPEAQLCESLREVECGTAAKEALDGLFGEYSSTLVCLVYSRHAGYPRRSTYGTIVAKELVMGISFFAIFGAKSGVELRQVAAEICSKSRSPTIEQELGLHKCWARCQWWRTPLEPPQPAPR